MNGNKILDPSAELLFRGSESIRDLIYENCYFKNGSFAADIIPDYGENLTKLNDGMTLKEIEEFATWSVREATLVLDTSLTISIFDRDTVRHALHELGHADQAARSPLQYRRNLENIRDKKGNILKHEDRPAEIYADQYKESVYGRIAK